jgi:cell division septum initiation protein DivIVA
MTDSSETDIVKRLEVTLKRPLLGSIAQPIHAARDEITALRQRVAELEEAANRLANAADAVGNQCFDTDTMSSEVAEMQAATLDIRALGSKT